MAKIKTIKQSRFATNDHQQSRTSSGAVISPDENTLWIGDTALEYDNMNPVFEKECTGLLTFTGIKYPLSRLSLISNRPTATSGRKTAYTDLGSSLQEGSGLLFQNPSFIRNLDKTERSTNGNMISFDDSGSNAHNTIFNCIQEETNSGQTRALILQGNDLGSPTAQVSSTLTTFRQDGSLTAGHQIRAFFPISIDATNKVIYATGVHFYHNTTLEDEVQGTRLVKIPFTTAPVDGTLTLGTPAEIATSARGTSNGADGRCMDATPGFYCGKNNAGDSCFLYFTEQERIRASGSVQDEPSTATKTTKGRYYFFKYAPSSDTTTIISDLKGTEGFVGNTNSNTDATSDHFSMHGPSHFEQSPINGETNIYYAYTAGFNASTGDMSILRFKWDKANDTFTMAICTLTMSGADTIQDYITYKQVDTNLNQYFRLNLLLTKNSSNYYLSVFYTHGVDNALEANTTSTLRNITTFSIDASDFSSLTYHSSASFPAIDYISLNADNTKVGTIEASNAKTYNWDNTNGWTIDATEPGVFLGISRDPSGRIFGVSTNTSDHTSLADDTNVSIGTAYKPVELNLHLISSDLPTTASVEFEDASITYTGSNLSKNLLVNAYDSSGNRVAKSVVLKITGGNAVFASNSGKSVTTTTSTSGNTSVGLTITGSGFINVSASFSI